MTTPIQNASYARLKEESIWINEWNSLDQVQRDIDKCIDDYNFLNPHSMLNDLSPVEFESEWSFHEVMDSQNSTQKAA